MSGECPYGAGDHRELIRQAKRDALTAAASELRHQAVLRFNERGPRDRRGAALWDAGNHIDPGDGDALGVSGEPGEGASVTEPAHTDENSHGVGSGSTEDVEGRQRGAER